jgi:glycosyltransferase involved in cell wall biosynthesis
MPLALMEAMSCGSCCVAFDCPCGPSELVTNGKTGMLIPAESIDDLASELERLMDCPDRRKQLGAAAYIYAKEHFSLEPVMRQWLNLLEI